MYNGRFNKKVMIALLTIMMFVGIGCGGTPRHSDTLIFGTSTKFALDFSADTTQAPSLTVGYKREEFVWMPLLANGQSSTVISKPSTSIADPKYTGVDGNNKDTYSVLASFGAKFPSGESKGGGGLAQYFATGLAARKLAEVGGARLVSTQADGSEETIQLAAAQVAAEYSKIDLIVQHIKDASGNLDNSKLKALTAGTGLPDTWADQFTTVQDVEKALRGKYRRSVDGLAKNIK